MYQCYSLDDIIDNVGQRQEDDCNGEASLGYIVNLCLHKWEFEKFKTVLIKSLLEYIYMCI